MKKIWVYLLGVLSGVILAIIALVIISVAINADNDPAGKMSNGMEFFEVPGDIIDESSFEVFQALGDGAALARGRGDGYSSFYSGINALLYNDEDVPYYDKQVIKAPQGKCFRQVGIYRYSSKGGVSRTVPIVMVMDR